MFTFKSCFLSKGKRKAVVTPEEQQHVSTVLLKSSQKAK